MKTDKKYRPLIYICSLFSGDVAGNTKRTIDFCRFALAQGQIPLAPQLMFSQFMDDEDSDQRELAILMDIVLIGKCSELGVLGDRISEGMETEISRAKQRRQRVRYFNSKYEEVKAI